MLVSGARVGGGMGGGGWLLHTNVLPPQAARYCTLDRGLRPGPESLGEPKNVSEIPRYGPG